MNTELFILSITSLIPGKSRKIAIEGTVKDLAVAVKEAKRESDLHTVCMTAFRQELRAEHVVYMPVYTRQRVRGTWPKAGCIDTLGVDR